MRDVLERNIVTQLRKIAFSALVYGTLVIVCLGGVVWGLSIVSHGILSGSDCLVGECLHYAKIYTTYDRSSKLSGVVCS